MTTGKTGTCEHGEFVLTEGCPRCVAKKRQAVQAPAFAVIPDDTVDQDAADFLAEQLDSAAPEIMDAVAQETVAETMGIPQQATIVIGPEADARVKALYAEAVHLLDLAEARVITENADLKSATEDLSVIARLKKALNEKKDEFVKPVRAFLNDFNDTFKTMLAPIEEADRITRDKMKGFKTEQQRKIAEAQAIEDEKLALAQREAELKGGEITVDLTPVEAPPPVPERVRTDIGTAGQRDNWKYEVVDFALLPDEYKMVDAALLNATAKRHHDQKHISGVRFYNEPTITVRTR